MVNRSLLLIFQENNSDSLTILFDIEKVAISNITLLEGTWFFFSYSWNSQNNKSNLQIIHTNKQLNYSLKSNRTFSKNVNYSILSGLSNTIIFNISSNSCQIYQALPGEYKDFQFSENLSNPLETKNLFEQFNTQFNIKNWTIEEDFIDKVDKYKKIEYQLADSQFGNIILSVWFRTQSFEILTLSISNQSFLLLETEKIHMYSLNLLNSNNSNETIFNITLLNQNTWVFFYFQYDYQHKSLLFALSAFNNNNMYEIFNQNVSLGNIVLNIEPNFTITYQGNIRKIKLQYGNFELKSKPSWEDIINFDSTYKKVMPEYISQLNLQKTNLDDFQLIRDIYTYNKYQVSYYFRILAAFPNQLFSYFKRSNNVNQLNSSFQLSQDKIYISVIEYSKNIVQQNGMVYLNSSILEILSVKMLIENSSCISINSAIYFCDDQQQFQAGQWFNIKLSIDKTGNNYQGRYSLTINYLGESINPPGDIFNFTFSNSISLILGGQFNIFKGEANYSFQPFQGQFANILINQDLKQFKYNDLNIFQCPEKSSGLQIGPRTYSNKTQSNYQVNRFFANEYALKGYFNFRNKSTFFINVSSLNFPALLITIEKKNLIYSISSIKNLFGNVTNIQMQILHGTSENKWLFIQASYDLMNKIFSGYAKQEIQENSIQMDQINYPFGAQFTLTISEETLFQNVEFIYCNNSFEIKSKIFYPIIYRTFTTLLTYKFKDLFS